MIYESIEEISKDEAERLFNILEGSDLCRLLIGISSVEDWKWAQEIFFQYIYHEDIWVAKSSIISLGHLARISGNIDKKRVFKKFKLLKINRPELSGNIEDAINDIKIFVK
jgi:hypothetical protein